MAFDINREFAPSSLSGQDLIDYKNALFSSIEESFGRPLTEQERSIINTRILPGNVSSNEPAPFREHLTNVMNALPEFKIEAQQQQFSETLFNQFIDVINRSIDIQEKEFATQEKQTEEQSALRTQVKSMISGLSGLDDRFVRSLGFEPVRDANGNMTDIKEIPFEQFVQGLNPIERDIFSIAKQTTERQLKLLQGDLPLSAQKEFDRQKRDLLETLTRNGILPGSTAYNNAISQLIESQGVIADTLVQQGAGLVGQSFGLTEAVRASEVGKVAQARAPVLEEISTLATGTVPFFTQPGAFAAGISPLVASVSQGAPAVSGAFGGALQPFQFRTNLAQQAAMAGQQARSMETAGLYQALGSGLGLAASLAAMK